MGRVERDDVVDTQVRGIGDQLRRLLHPLHEGEPGTDVADHDSHLVRALRRVDGAGHAAEGEDGEIRHHPLRPRPAQDHRPIARPHAERREPQ